MISIFNLDLLIFIGSVLGYWKYLGESLNSLNDFFVLQLLKILIFHSKNMT